MNITANPNKLNECAILGTPLDLYEMGLETQRETAVKLMARNRRIAYCVIITLMVISFGLGAWIC